MSDFGQGAVLPCPCRLRKGSSSLAPIVQAVLQTDSPFSTYTCNLSSCQLPAPLWLLLACVLGSPALYFSICSDLINIVSPRLCPCGLEWGNALLLNLEALEYYIFKTYYIFEKVIRAENRSQKVQKEVQGQVRLPQTQAFHSPGPLPGSNHC